MNGKLNLTWLNHIQLLAHCFRNQMSSHKFTYFFNHRGYEHAFFLHALMSIKWYIFDLNTMHTLTTFSLKHVACQSARAVASRRKHREIMKWRKFNKILSDEQFRSSFRVDRLCFKKLCEKIESAVGEKDFKSEVF